MAEIIQDWIHLVDDLGIITTTNNNNTQQTYQYHNGKPVLAIWGFGIRDIPGPQHLQKLLDWFVEDNDTDTDKANNNNRKKYNEVTIMGGVDNTWRYLDQDWIDQLSRFDIIILPTVHGLIISNLLN